MDRIRIGENSMGKVNLKRCVLSFERNVERDNELRLSGGRIEFQSRGATTEKAVLSRDVRTGWTEPMNQMIL